MSLAGPMAKHLSRVILADDPTGEAAGGQSL